MSIATTIDVGVLAYQALPFLQDCLRTLDECYPDRHLILVNDHDETTRPFCEQYVNAHPGVDYFFRPKRGWFTRAANTALQMALNKPLPEWFLLLNSDVVIRPGSFEEMFECWHVVEALRQGPVGLVGSEGPQPRSHRRYDLKREPQYVTGHALLFYKPLMRLNNFRFPQNTGEVSGFLANQLVHISSDRALSYMMNRKGLLTVASYWSDIGHYGGKSWGHNLASIPGVVGLD